MASRWRSFRRDGSARQGQASFQANRRVLVREGLYKITRNPIYIGLILTYFGLCLILTSVWMLLLLIPAAIVLHQGVVKREEEYLDWKFGEDYRRYLEQVPRWL